jgi:hypothetical protein
MPLTYAKFDTYLDTKRPPFTRHIRPQREQPRCERREVA